MYVTCLRRWPNSATESIRTRRSNGSLFPSIPVLAMKCGLDSAILDPTNRDMMGVIYATEALLGLDDYCMEYISAYREGLFGPKK